MPPHQSSKIFHLRTALPQREGAGEGGRPGVGVVGVIRGLPVEARCMLFIELIRTNKRKNRVLRESTWRNLFKSIDLADYPDIIVLGSLRALSP